MKKFKFGGSRGHWWVSWTDNYTDWKTTNFQYKCDMNRQINALRYQHYQFVGDNNLTLKQQLIGNKNKK